MPEYGKAEYWDERYKANDTTFGGAVPIIASNIHFDDVTGVNGAALASMYGEGDSGAPLVPWATKTLSNGLKIGFIGLMGYDAALVAPGKSPIAFSVPITGSECADAEQGRNGDTRDG